MSIAGNSRQQLLSVGRSNALKYTYIRKDDIRRNGNNPDILIRDLKHNELKENSFNRIPPGNAISVRSRFDGSVIILENDICIQQIQLKGKEETIISDINLGITIRFIIGNDCMREISFEKERGISEEDDKRDSLLLMRIMSNKGKRIAIDHSIASLVKYMDNLPDSREWLLKQIRAGWISENALRQIKSLIRNLSREGVD